MNQGLKNYTKQFIHEVSGVGNLAINMCGSAKNMHIVLPLINTVGNNPISLSLIYNEQDKDVTSQFGKGFRLNLYKKITSTDEGYNVFNADGSVDEYLVTTDLSTTVYSYNKETELTLTQEEDTDSVYRYFLKDNKGNSIAMEANKNYPKRITNAQEQTISFTCSGEQLVNVFNEFGDNINITTSTNLITLTYLQDNVSVSKTELVLTDGELTSIKYYEGTSTLIHEVSITYLTSGILLINEKECNMTKVEYSSTTSEYKVYDHFINEYQEITFSSTPDFTIKYNTLNTTTYNKTTLTDKFGNYEIYYFDNSHLLNMIEDQYGRVKFYSFNSETKKIKAANNVFIKDENNLANNLSFDITSSGGDLGIIGPTEPVLGSQTTVAEIWNKLTYYSTAGSSTKTITVSAEAGDVITLSFFLSVFAESSIGAVRFTLYGGGVSKTEGFVNEVGSQLEMHSISIVVKEKCENVQVTLTIPSGSKVRVGAYTMLKKKINTEYQYEDGNLVSLDGGKHQLNIEYDEQNNPTEIQEETERLFTLSYSNRRVQDCTDEYGLQTIIEYDNGTPPKIVKKSMISEAGFAYMENETQYSTDRRFVSQTIDESNQSTQYLFDKLGRIKKVTNALGKELLTTYEKGLMKTLALGTSLSNTYTYDERNRLSTIKTPNETIYQFIYDYKNQITQVKLNNEVILIYEYDSNGFITKKQNGLNGDYYRFSYDTKGRLSQIFYGSSLEYEFSYDNQDRLVQIFNDSDAIRSFVYDEEGRLVSEECFDDELNTTVELNNKFNSHNELVNKKVKVLNKPIVQSFDNFDRSGVQNDLIINYVKTIGFLGTNLELDGKQSTQLFSIYPLHHDPESLNGGKPFTFLYKNLEGSDKPKTPFVYNATTKRYVYCANYGTLAYKFGNSTSGTIMARVFKTTTNNEYLFGLVDNNGEKIDVLLEGGNSIVMYVNGSVVTSTRMSFSPSTWHTVAISYGKGENASSTDTSHTRYYRLFLDGTVKTHSVTSNVEYTSMKSCIGYKEGSSNTFTGYMEMLCFRNAYCEESTLDELMNSINIISTKSYVDEFRRICKKEITKGSNNIISSDIEYRYLGTDKTSYQVGRETIICQSEIERRYEYDQVGRITSINDDVYGEKTYSYDDRGFLIKDNGTNIEYDKNGNITKYGTTVYEYASSQNTGVVNDLLIKAGNKTITYSTTNKFLPVTIGTDSLSWKGKRLASYNSYGFTYNEYGQRISKTLAGNLVSSYYYDGDRLVTEVKGSNRLDFLYDEQGLLYGFIYNGTVKYFYMRDVLQNILGLVDENGNIVVEYDYTAYGKSLSVTGLLKDTIGVINPFRYKGYYYDVETQLFYCNSRYYSPELCRWISPDSIDYLDPESINGLNLYCYCGNNPIMYADSSGHMPEWVKTGLVVLAGAIIIAAVVALTVASGGTAAPVLIGAALGATASGVSSAAMQMLENGKIDVAQLIIDITVGGVMGAFGGSTIGRIGMTLAGGGTGFASSIADNWVHGEEIDIMAALGSAAIGAVFAYNAGPGKQFGTKANTASIKGTLEKIAQKSGSWKKGLTKMYTNKLNAVTNQAISQIKSGFGEDCANNVIQYLITAYL